VPASALAEDVLTIAADLCFVLNFLSALRTLFHVCLERHGVDERLRGSPLYRRMGAM
jgi:hypothetical protein